MDTDKLFYSLASMLAVDDEISSQELRFLHTIRQKLNIPNSVVISALDDVKKGKHRVHLPKTKVEQDALLKFLIQAAYSDGNLSSQEDNMLRVVADKIGVSATELETTLIKHREFMHSSVGSQASERIAKVLEFEHGESHGTAQSSVSGQVHRNPHVPLNRQCPKCGYRASSLADPLYTGDQGNGECPACGIVLARYRTSPDMCEKLENSDDLKSQYSVQGGVQTLTKIIVPLGIIIIFIFFGLSQEHENIYNTVYRISEIVQAQTEAKAQKKTIMFIYSRERSRCPHTQDAYAYLVKKCRTGLFSFMSSPMAMIGINSHVLCKKRLVPRRSGRIFPGLFSWIRQ